VTSSVVLIPGAGGMGWYWHLVEAELRRRGYDAFAVDLPAADETKGLPAYADAVVVAIGDRSPVTIVAQSLAGFTAPFVWQRVPTQHVVFVNAMIPLPGETASAWWDNVGWEQARTAAAVREGYPAEFDLDVHFLHDMPAELKAVMYENEAPQSKRPFADVCAFDDWPDIPIHAVAGRDDRFFPLELQQRIVHERLGIEGDVVPGGHLVALSRPRELSALLASYLDAMTEPRA
jgi:pimeloyl-ACP methyl ester carboxylesterase